MLQISLIDETFNGLNSEHYKLTIQFLPDGFSYTLLDNVRKKYVLLKHYQFKNNEKTLDEINGILATDKLFNFKYESVRTFIFTKNITIIPSVFSDREKISKFTTFNFGEINSNESYECKAAFDSTLAFCLEQNIIKILSSLNCHIFYPHAITVLAEAQKDCLQKENCTGMYLSLLSGNAEVVVVKNSKLQLFNIFQYHSEDDLCYYFIYLFNLFQFDKEKTPVTVSGITQKNDSRLVKIEQFINKLQFSKPSSKYIYSYRFNEVPKHHFSNLFIMPYEDNKR